MIKDIDIDVADWSMFESMDFDKKNLSSIACVYFLFNDDELVYVGSTKNLKQRANYHDVFLNSNTYLGKEQIGEDTFNKILYHQESDIVVRKELEKKYYEAFEPKCNFHGLYSPPNLYGDLGKYNEFMLKFGLEKRWNL